MFQRWGHRQPAIGYPTHFTELDQDDGYYDRYLETIPEVESISSRRQSTQLALPELPFRAVASMDEIPQPVNIQPRPNPTSPTRHPRERGLRIQVPTEHHDPAADVSPLTPDAAYERNSDENPISPIDGVASSVRTRNPLPERAVQSQIPRKVSKPKRSQDKAETRWDTFSGEPTQDRTGMPASVRPGTQPVELQYPHLKERTKQILAGLREREAAKQHPPSQVPPPELNTASLDQPQRKPWKGASGRTAILEPVTNNPTARQSPLLPSNENAGEPFMDAVQERTPVEMHTPTADSSYIMDLEEDITPVVPLKSAKRNNSRDLPPNELAQFPAGFEPYRPMQSNEPVIMHARVDSPPDEREPTTPTTPTAFGQPHLDEKMDEPSPPYESPDLDAEQSRFSWTTYTTSVDGSTSSPFRTVYNSSPPIPSAIPPPINIRKRPISANVFANYSPYSYNSSIDQSFSPVSRKPLPKAGARTSNASTMASRILSMSKSLPPTPTVVEATDKIENLDAQIEALNRRKYNITRIIRDLEQALKKNAITYDMWKRKEVEKNIANHKLDLDEVNSEIHEISIRSHRAQRKRDREDGYEACTGLWIKRVTS